MQIPYASEDSFPILTRIFHGVMVMIGNIEPEGRPVRSFPRFSK